MKCKVVLSVVIAVIDVEVVSIYLDVVAQTEVSWGDKIAIFVHILVLISVEELSFDDARVLLGWLENGNGVVRQVEGNDELSALVFWYLSVEFGCKPEDLLVVVNVLEEVCFWLVGDQLVDVAKGIVFISEAVVGWDLLFNVGPWFWLFNLGQFEVVTIGFLVKLLGCCVHTSNLVTCSVGCDVHSWLDFVASQVVITYKVLSWLVDAVVFWQLLSSQMD